MRARILPIIFALLWPVSAFAQPATVLGPVTPGNFPAFNSTTVIKDSGVSGLHVVQGPGSSAIGNIAFFNNTIGTLLGAQAAFQSTNPANAALYSQLAQPTAGSFLTPHNGLQVSIGTALGSADQIGQGTVGNLQAIVGTVQTLSGNVGDVYSVAGYAKTNSSGDNVVGVGGFGFCNVAGSSCWGGNFGVNNVSPIVNNGGFNANAIYSLELDVNVWKGPGGIDPTFGNGPWGIYITGGGDSVSNMGTGIGLHELSVTTAAKWVNGFYSFPGAAVNALIAGPSAKTGTSVPSQNILIQEFNGAGTLQSSTISSDGGGDLSVRAPAGGTAILGNASTSYLVAGPVGGAGVQLFQLASAGMIVNSATGVLSSIPTGTGVQTALGVAVGTAGAFVVNGGALGTPSSGVGTNLTGTASGLTAGHVTTNANLTGPITSTGNATAVAAQTGTGSTFVMQNGAPTLGLDGSTVTIGPGGTGALNARLNIVGANATAQGADLNFQKNGSAGWFIGHVSAIEATGTSSDLEYFNTSTTARTMRLSFADDDVAFASIVDATSTAGTTAAINTAGGISAAKQVQAGTNFKVGSTAGLASKTCTINTTNVTTGITITITGGIVTGTTTC